MSKYKHHKDTLIVLNDLQNRMQQLIEASQTSNALFVDTEVRAIQACKSLVEQCIRTGHVFRGSSAVPDGLEQYFTTPSVTERLGVSDV